ncbi:MAG TPA: MliC family protein [Candidatus Paceibacterota bacterium]|nr:MliC family protein [Candidatus Paceibacterota bacterium]
MTSNTFWAIIALIIIIVGGYLSLRDRLTGSTVPPTTASSTPMIINTVAYSCDQGATIDASFTQNSVDLTLSDGRSLTLPQTISGSGIRYELSATSSSGTPDDVVFWSEGDNAFLTENSSTTYQDCIAGTVTQNGSTTTFTDAGKTFSFSYPSEWSVIGGGGGYTQSWMTNATTSGMILAEIKIPQSYLPGTNFGDATFTVGTSADPSALATCLSYNPTGGPKTPEATTTINGTQFTVFQSHDAAAGNRYDTTSYRTSMGSQCYAVEYTIHYAVFQNYPPGTVKQFDESALKAQLDGVVQSFQFLPQQ